MPYMVRLRSHWCLNRIIECVLDCVEKSGLLHVGTGS